MVWDWAIKMATTPWTGRIQNEDPDLPLGYNGSVSYAENKNALICFAIPKFKVNSTTRGMVPPEMDERKFVRFKAFVSEYSRKAVGNYEEKAFAIAEAPRVIKSTVEHTINLTFDAPSQSYNESRANLEKVQTLCQIFKSSRERNEQFAHDPGKYAIYVLFSNFIHGLGEDNKATKFDAKNYEEVIDHGQKCIITGFSFDFDLESGFFEGNAHYDPNDDGKLFPKNITISFELSPIIETNHDDDNKKTSNFLGFGGDSADPTANNADKPEWTPMNYPFGIDYDN